MRKILLILIFAVIGLEGFSQQDPQYSLYMFNPLGVNPGYTGSREVLSAVLVHRSQWIGLDGAPQTSTLAVNTPLKNKKMGLGLQIVNDEIGPKTMQTLKATYAYRLKLGSGKLAFGLSGGVLNYNYDWAKIEYKEQDDAVPNTSAQNFMIPTFDFGIYYNSRTFYLGLSIDHINEAKFSLNPIDTVTTTSIQKAQSKLTIGKAFILNDNLILKTSALFRVSDKVMSADLNFGLLMKNKVLFGLALRKEAIIVYSEINISKNLRMGLAYDYDASDLGILTSGSLELFLGYDIGLFKSKVMSPRYF